MSGAQRLTAGGRIDRTRPLTFTFDGRRYSGFAGDTLASALLASGAMFVARSFKYHRPRGILSAGAEEPNALVQLADGAYTEPNLRATQIELYEGLNASSINAWPSLRYDWSAINDRLGRLLAAGFYYKTFIRPKLLWDRLYEPMIRRMAGLGRAPALPDPDLYDKMHAHCDVLVVGGGSAGLAAALAAGRTGARVILADEQSELGGGLLASGDTIDGRAAAEWLSTAVAELAAQPETVLLPRTTAFGYYDHNYLMLIERRTDHLGPGARPGLARQRLWHVRAREVVLATGAHERPLIFADNDRPGTMLAGAVEAYVRRYAVRPGARAVFFTNNDGAYRAALALADAGAEVAAIADLRPRAAGHWPEAARRRGLPVMENHAVTATHGRTRIAAVEIAALNAPGNAVAGPAQRFDCDLLAMSGGWNPAVHLFSQSQGRLRFDERIAGFVPHLSAQREHSVGAARGSFALGDCLAEGFAAGAAAAKAAGFGSGEASRAPEASHVAEEPLRAMWLVPSPRAAARDPRKRFVDFQHDVTAADIRLAAREGFVAVEHMKRYTTAGMGTDQGKTANLNALALLSDAVGRVIAETGTTTFRPPYTPVCFGALAGRELGELGDPVRVTPIHAWHAARGAVFEDVGQWKRARFYPRPGEDMDQAVRRECRAVRTSVGALDASTLGKIEIAGPDAAEFLDRLYTCNIATLAPGRCRYGLMCRDDGMVFDDGVVTRLAADRFYATTTTGGAARVMDWLEEWLQTEWPDLKVFCTSVTEQWATAAVTGPRAREVMRALGSTIPLDPGSFPPLAMREGEVAGLAARVFRIGYSGELSYEINVPTHHGLALWDALMAAGERFGIAPYGTEAMHLLRAEKGFIVVGQETDGSVTPLDLGLDRMVSKQKDFIGKRSLARAAMRRSDRKQLVGLLPAIMHEVLPEGTQLVAARDLRPPVPMLGHVTSSYWSPTLGRSFALALVKAGRSRVGTSAFAAAGDRAVPVGIVDPVFFDREGERQRG